jgi:hypothetical protein
MKICFNLLLQSLPQTKNDPCASGLPFVHLKVTVQQAKEDKSLEEAGMGPHNREEVVKMSANQSNGGIDRGLNVFC